MSHLIGVRNDLIAYHRVECAEAVYTPVNPIIKVSNATSYTIASTTATQYRTRVISGLQDEFFRARVTVGISPNGNDKGYSRNNYGSVDTIDALGVTGTEDFNRVRIGISNDTFALHILIPPDTLNLDDSDVITDNYRAFYYDQHRNSFYVDLLGREDFNPPEISHNTPNWTNAAGTTLTLDERNAIEQALNAGDTFDIVIVANRTVTLTQFLETVSTAHGEWSEWSSIPSNKIITLPAVTSPNYYQIQCADSVSVGGYTNNVLKVTDDDTYTIASTTATHHRNQQVRRLPEEFFRARVTVGTEGTRFTTTFKAGFSAGNYGSIDTQDTTTGILASTINDISHIVFFVGTLEIITPVFLFSVKLFYRDSNNNHFTVNNITVRSNDDGLYIIRDSHVTTSNFQLDSISRNLSEGDTFDIVLTSGNAGRNITQAQFEASLPGGTNDALAAAYSDWQQIPTNKVITLPQRPITLFRIPTSSLPTTVLNFFPSPYPTDTQIDATYEGNIQAWTGFSGVTGSSNQGELTQNTQTIGGVSYTMMRVLISHGGNQIRMEIRSTGTISTDRTNLASKTFYLYRTDGDGNFINNAAGEPWIEILNVSDADTNHGRFTFRWNRTADLNTSVLYATTGTHSFGIKVATTPTE